MEFMSIQTWKQHELNDKDTISKANFTNLSIREREREANKEQGSSWQPLPVFQKKAEAERETLCIARERRD
jgi:hypothetical protein